MQHSPATSHLFALSGFLAMLMSASSHASTDSFSTGPGQGGPDAMCDVWQAVFNGWGLAPNDDEDRDGCSNWVESIAGTNPRMAGDCHKVGSTTVSATTVIFSFEAEAGKKYRILSKSTPAGIFTNAQDLKTINGAPQSAGVTEFVPLVDAATTLSVTKVGTVMFYKLEVSDVDSDADGVSDWAEVSTGLNPNLKDSDGDGVEDGDVIAAEVSAPNVISISSTTPFASEDGPANGMFTVSRTRSLIDATVTFELSGTAANPADFGTSPTNSVTFVSGEKTKQIHVNPNPDSDVEGSESVTARLMTTDAGSYAPPVIDPDKDEATVIIQNSTAATGTGLLATYYDTASATYTSANNFNPAQLKFTRIDPVVDNDWAYGTPNNIGISGNTTSDNYSAVWEGYLRPTTAGNYQFQLDADDKARVLLDTGGGLVQIIEHNWDTPGADPVGTFKESAPITLAVPGTPAARYKIRVEMVETTGEARCRLQWRRGAGTYANIPQSNVYTHTQTMSSYAVSSSVLTVNTDSAHGLSVSDPVDLWFLSGLLFSTGSHNTSYTVASIVDADSFTVGIPGAPNTSGDGYVGNASSGTTGWLNQLFNNTTFTAPPGRVGIDNAGATNANNGIYGSGSPDPSIGRDTFSIRWTGQVQPQFSETYTFAVHADDGCRMWINDAELDFRMSPNGTADGNTYVYDNVTGDTVVTYTNSDIATGTFAVGDVVRLDPNGGSLRITATGSSYTYDSVTGDAVINYSNVTNVVPGGFATGETVEVDPTSGPVNLGLIPYEITAATATTFTVNFGAGLFLSGSGNVNISDNTDRTITAVTPTTFTVNFGAGKYAASSGQLMNIFGLNLPLKPWASNGNERYARVTMQAGVRYNLKLEYYENSSYSRCRLFWFSPSQPKQIIPSARLYPETGVVHAPPAHITETEATALVGGAFSIPIAGSNGGIVSLNGNPAWLSYSGGVLSGTPAAGDAGDYQILITITNADGTSTSVLNLHVEDTGATIPREFWSGVSGSSVADIPISTPPTGTSDLTSLEAPTDFGDNYGTRIRGYITAPETGNYYFWIAGSNAAELWISNDDEPVNAFKRAWVSAGSATPRSWSIEASQRSPWLALEQGHRYYVEILHKAGVGAGDNLAVGWSKPGESPEAPSEVVPGYILSPFIAPPPGSTPGTLYVATMLSQNGAATSGVGSSTLRLSEDESYAIMTRSYANLTGPITSEHIHVDPYLNFPSTIVFDIDDPGVEQTNAGGGMQPDGSYKWIILPVGALTKPDIIEIIKQGKAYINLHTALYPAGEIRGNYTLADGSRAFTPPPPPPPYADDHSTDVGAVRFLQQATFGPNVADIAALKAMPSYEAWIDDQFTKPASHQLQEIYRAELANAQGGAFDETLSFNAWWFNSISGDDQLRQRIAFALSQIHVVSAQGPLNNNAPALSYFYDKLADNAFSNFREILEDTTLTPTMGRYLDMLRNDKPDQSLGRIPNENYAREIKQLFSVGLFRMWPDGSLMLTSKDTPIDTYSQREIVGFSHVFTGWDYGYDGPDRTALNAPANWTRPMRVTPARHFTGPKRLLNNEVLPGLTTVGGKPLDPFALHNSTNYSDPTYKALPDAELAAAHDQLFHHPNIGPFICRQLIQRLVTSHPSRDYLYRVVSAFNDNGAGVRGDMQAVIKAILLDYEARSPAEVGKPAYGKQREPLLRVAAAARAFRPNTFTGTYSQSGTRTITINTTTPHGVTGNVFLEFAGGSPDPWTGIYGSSNVNTTRFTVQAQGWATGTYSIPAGSTTCTVTMSNHWLQVGHQIFIDFTSGTANGTTIDQSVYTLATASAQTGSGSGSKFTFTVASDPAVRSGNCMIPRFTPGSYTARSSGLPYPNDRRVTMDTNYDHHLSVGDQVQLNYTAGNPLPADAVVTVDTIDDPNTWSYLTNSDAATGFAANENNNGVYQFPLLSQPLVRSGTINSRSSTYNMGSTETDLDQSPINAPTVFNYFLPDFKNPGTLASQGITTPEFQTTAETTVIRQANFLYAGVHGSTTASGGNSSFKTGNNSLVLDLNPWMTLDAADIGLGAPASTTLPWTHNQNLDTLIGHFDTLLTARKLSAEAKTIIKNLVGLKISSIAATNPCTVTTVDAHGYSTGDSVVISGATGGTYSTGTLDSNTTARTITATSPNTFTLDGVSCTAAPSSVANAHASPIPYNQGSTNPSTTNKRDRLRAIIHLILTSSDFTIQR